MGVSVLTLRDREVERYTAAADLRWRGRGFSMEREASCILLIWENGFFWIVEPFSQTEVLRSVIWKWRLGHCRVEQDGFWTGAWATWPVMDPNINLNLGTAKNLILAHLPIGFCYVRTTFLWIHRDYHDGSLCEPFQQYGQCINHLMAS